MTVATSRATRGKPEAFEPWEHPVNLAEVLDEVRAVFEAYVYVSDHCLDALALYTVYTHCCMLFQRRRCLDLSSPAMRCGKSSTLTIIRSWKPARWWHRTSRLPPSSGASMPQFHAPWWTRPTPSPP